MAKSSSTASTLSNLIMQLQRERGECEQRIQEIDKTFKSFGLRPNGRSVARAAAAPVKRQGKAAQKGAKSSAKSVAPAAKKRAKSSAKNPTVAKKAMASKGKAQKNKGAGRRSFATTGEQFLLSYIKEAGNATTEQIRKAWSKAGRGGKPENYLTNLVKSGKLMRVRPLGSARSVYSLGAAAAVLESRPAA